MTRAELENFLWKWGRHIEAATFLLLMAFIVAIALLSRR